VSNKKQFTVKNVQIDLWEDWVDWFKGKEQNWYEFTFFEFRFEDESHMGMKELAFALIGLHVKFSWMYDPAKFAAATLGEQDENEADAPQPPPNPPTP
jgi:hypothetical protein